MPALYQVDVKDVPADHAVLTKALRVIGKMPLQRSAEIATFLQANGGGTVAAGIERSVADHIVGELGKASLKATVSETSVSTPMTCSPEAAESFRWTSTRQLVSG
ncbi:MAG TPA: hypothetical protein VK519_04995 [Pinirhizobacter sp.]|uniref:hypothetical protein n=1 Tax=Pinirhizobacter sp. TaxID=2950432 RepID=UPI002B838BD3|nr:hypothetical protein [Pinirhizobacter sp.]HMH67259.1 hypothetical protein [Pinirhizobacter sp.]